MSCRRKMQGNIEVGDDPTVIESESEDGVTASLWTKHGRRLYLNGYKDRYVDLDEGSIEGGYTGGLAVEVDDGTLTISGRGTTVVVDLDLDAEEETEEDEAEEDATEPTPQAAVAGSGEMATALAGDAAGQHGTPPDLPRESAMAGLEQSLDKPDGDESLEVGDVFWNVTSAVGDGGGYHKVYLGNGEIASLSGGSIGILGDRQIRDDLHTGKLKRASVDELTDEERANYDERMADVDGEN